MRYRLPTLIAVCLLASLGFAKDKTKSTLPTYVLRAQTVAVIIDPNAGISIDDPQANQAAQRDVESALVKWGRYNPILHIHDADLVIVVRKGTGRAVNGTIRDPRQNNRAGSINPLDDGVSIAAQHGPQPSTQQNPPGVGSSGGISPQAEIGDADDSFLVYQGGGDYPLDRSPVWRYVKKDGLEPQTVPAVEAFRKAVVDADKAAAKNP